MPVTFEVTFMKCGNPVGFSIPKPIRDGMNLNPRDKITIVVENDKICIENYSLKQSNFLRLVMKS
jgi:bifunctional DNA-binding transcriptional regulator/antitoxin component of YhaV-PrlF toxin-antitoxin module